MKNNKLKEYYEGINSLKEIPQLGILGYLRGKLIKFEEDRMKTCLNMFPRKTKSMLDIGCNDGELLIRVSNRFTKGIGVDISDVAIKKAQENVRLHKLSSKIKLIRSTAENKMPFQKDEFDLVTALAVLEHIFDPENFLIDVKRITKKGGYLIVEVPNVAWLPRRLSLLFGKMPRMSWAPGWDGGHVNYFTFGSLKKLLENVGFQIKEIGCSGVFSRLRYLYPALLSGNIIILAKKK